jgi:signal transduction histidine kinase
MAAEKMAGSSPLGQLLHALNQPLTGLQCSMEVALVGPRTSEQYVHGLREGLELTERMRALVEAIREVVDVEKEENREPNVIELKPLLREVLDDLEPVAEVKSVRVTLDCSAASSLAVKGGRRIFATLVFRCLESALSLAALGSVMLIETGGAAGEGWIRIRWQAESPLPALSRPEIGLLVAQAGWERAGAEWERERRENLETVTVRLPRVSAPNGNS